MKSVLPTWALLTEGFFALCCIDVALEWCLIYLLHQRDQELWVKMGSPRASIRGYVRNCPFNGRQFVMSQSDRGCHDPLLSGYCWVYRIFNVIFTSAYMVLVVAVVIFLGTTLWRVVVR